MTPVCGDGRPVGDGVAAPFGEAATASPDLGALRSVRRRLFGGDIGILLKLGKSMHQDAQVRRSEVRSELSPAQFAVLFAIARVPGATQTQVCELASLSPAATSVQIARLSAEGKVVVVENASDRRRMSLYATVPARREVDDYMGRLLDAEEWMLGAIRPHERDRLLDLLDRTAFTDEARRSRAAYAKDDNAAVLNETHAFGRLVRVNLQRYGSAWAARVRSHSLSAHAFLRVIEDIPGCNQRLIGECLSIDPTSVAGLVSRLRQKGLISAMPSEEDRRQRLLNLTDAGLRVLRAHEEAREQVGQQHLGPLGESERHDLLELLAKVTILREPSD
jgi:DNA-binding MarR family transcriptional regulator